MALIFVVWSCGTLLSTQWQGATTPHNKSQPLSYYKVYRQVDDFVYVNFKNLTNMQACIWEKVFSLDY